MPRCEASRRPPLLPVPRACHGISVRAPPPLPRCAAQADFEARRLQVRCGAKQLCSRGKRYVHVLQATACRPTACLLALAAAAPEDVELSSLLRWPAAPLVQNLSATETR